MPDLYFNRVPSPPATDDGSARSLAEDLSTGSGDGEDITRDADMASTDGAPAAAGPDVGPGPVGAEPDESGAGAGQDPAGQDTARREAEPEFTEADVAFLTAPPEAASAPGLGARLHAIGLGTADQPGTGATTRVNGDGDAAGEGAVPESGRWIRPTRAKKRYAAIPPEEQGDSAGAAVDLDNGGAATQDPAEPGPEPAASAAPGPPDAEEGAAPGPPDAEAAPSAGADPEDTAPAGPMPEPEPMPEPCPADVSAPADPADVRARAADVWTPPYRGAGWAASAAGRVGSAAGRMSALLRPGGLGPQARPNGSSNPPFPDGAGLASPPSPGRGAGAAGRRVGAAG